jgi:hypothetical protein
MTSRSKIALVAFCTLFVANTTHAYSLTGPAYPAPGGNSFSLSGNAGNAGGSNGSYSAFDASYFDTLFWGPQWGTDPGPRAGLDGTLHTLSFLSASGTTAIWQGTTSYTSPGGPGPASCGSCNIRLEIDISGLGANPWALEASVLGLTSLAPGIGAVVSNPNGLDFTANFQFLADLGSGFVAINDVPNGGGLTVSSLSGAFYYTPEPSIGMLFAAGLLGLSVRRKRAA